MAQSGKSSAAKKLTYVDLDNDDKYEKYRSNAGLSFSRAVMLCGGYTKWFEDTFKDEQSNIFEVNENLKLTYGVSFGGLMRDRFQFPKDYTYDYDIILRIVRGEKRFIAGQLTSQEFVYNLYIKTSVENYSDVVSKFLKRYNIISSKTDASIHKDKRRSLSLQGANSGGGLLALVDRTKKNDEDAKESDDNNKKSTGDAEVKEESKYEHRVCNQHPSAAKEKKNALKDIQSRVGEKYSVSITTGIPDFASMSEADETDVIVSFVQDDVFKYQATYLKKSTFEKASNEEKKEIYDKLYKWPKSAKEIFGSDIPKENTTGLLSVFTTTKVNIKQ